MSNRKYIITYIISKLLTYVNFFIGAILYYDVAITDIVIVLICVTITIYKIIFLEVLFEQSIFKNRLI